MNQDRIGFLDALRGFALFGILVVNLPFMGFTIHDHANSAAPPGVHSWASFAVSAFFELKFFLLFCFLFGISFSLLVPERAGPDHVWPWFRRMVGLLAFGLFHSIFLFVGDILTSYAVLGIALLLVRNRNPQTLVRGGIACLVCAVIVYSLVALAAGDELAATGSNGAAAAAAREAYLGGFWSGARQRLSDLASVIPFLAFIQWLPAFAMFLFGLAAGRSRRLAELPALVTAHGRTAKIAGAIGIAGNLWFAASSRSGDVSLSAFFAFALSPLFAPCLSFAYVYILAWLYTRAAGPWTLLEAAGRLSLTNYLLQAVIGGFLFNGWGLGLLGQWQSATLLAAAAVIYLAQIHLSRWYLRYFRTGPDEWLLRSFSRWRWQPFRIASSSP